MIEPIKSQFLNDIKEEIKVFTKNETYINSNDPLGNLIHELFQVASHTRFTGTTEYIDKRLIKTINQSISYLENMIVELALKYEKVILEHHKQIIDPQKFIDYIQSEAKKLSFILYPAQTIKILRNFHVYYLTFSKASNSLVKARIKKAHSDIKRIVANQKIRKDPIIENDDFY